MSTQLDEKTEVTQETTDPIHTHIVQGTDGKKGGELIIEALLEGTMVEALCGHRWIPYRDPQKHPICPKCEQILGEIMAIRSL